MVLRQASFGFSIFLLLATGALAYRGVQRLVEQDYWVEHALAVLDALEDFNTTLLAAESNQRGYLLTDDSSYLDRYREAVGKIPRGLGNLRNLTSDNADQQRRLDALDPLVAMKLGTLAEAVRLHRDHLLSAEEQAQLARGRAVIEHIRSIITAMNSEESELYRTRNAEVKSQARIVVLIFVAAAIIALGLLAFVFYRMAAEVRLRRKAEQVAKELNDELEARVKDRTAELVDSNMRLQGEISERRRIGEAHREASETLGAVIEAAPFAINCLSPDRRVLIWNKAAEEMFGYSAREIMGQVYPLVPEEGRHEFEELLRRARRGEMSRDMYVTRQRKDGRVIEIRLASAPLFDRDGALRGNVGILEDVTERKNTEQQLRHAQKMEAVGQLTGGVAHDFNNLLTIIISNLDLLEERLSGRQDELTLLEAARSAGLRGAELTQRLLAFARKQPLQPRAMDFNERLPGVVSLLKRTLGDNISVNAMPGANLWPALVDPLQLENAIVNLAINARDAMPRGGQLVIETGNVHLDEHYAAQNAEVMPGDYVMLAVTDTGTGMSPAVAERAFEPFFTTKEVGQGTGLGLSMVYGFTKQSGGHAKIYSELGRGTTVKLYLPRADGSGTKDGPAPAQGREASPGGREAILVVEDSAEVRQIAVAMLEQLGYSVHAAANGKEALALLQGATSVDLLFTDIVMPEGLSGYELAQEASRLRPEIKVLFTSGYSAGFMRSDATRNGAGAADLMLGKPYRKQELARKVRAALDGTPDP